MPRGLASSIVVLVLLGLVVGGAWYLLGRSGARTQDEIASMPVSPEAAPAPANAPGVYARRLAELQDEVRKGREERQALAAEVGRLRAALEELPRPAASRVAARATGSPHAPASSERAPSGPRSMDAGILVEAGFPREMVYDVKSRVDQMELDRLYLRDIATREGWVNTRRFREEYDALRFDTEANREEYGEEFYDWMLFATGRPNRVRIDSIMSGSAAQETGLREGDQVLRYGGNRVFTASDLTSGTMAGEPGEATPVEVLREGRLVRVDVPRGPLGVRVALTVAEPQPSR